MAKYGIRASRRKEAPKATIQAAPTFYERTHPVGSAEKFLDDAAREALASAAVAAMPAPNLGRFVPGAAREAAIRYPDPLLTEAARLPEKALAESAARAEAYRKAMEAQNEAVRVASAALSPVGNMAVNQAGADGDVPFALKAGRTCRNVRAAEEGGEAAGPETPVSETPVSEAPQNPGGPRIVINPTTFHNKKDALCVAFNEGFRVWMEANGFEPQSEPTDAQRKFFSDTAYADDEVQLRRTILARIATFDTSVKDPTDDQLSETASFLGAVLESDWCRNEWERDSVSRLMNAVQSAVGAEPAEPRQEPLEAREAEPLQRHAAMGGGETDDEDDKFADQTAGKSDQVDEAERRSLEEREAAQTADTGDKNDEEPPQQAEPQQAEPQNDGRLQAGIDRSEFGQNGRIGIGARIVDPETGRSRSSLSMNGPSIQPARWIGDIGARSLADAKSMNGPAIEPVRAIGDLGGTELADAASMNGPAIGPVRDIGDVGARSLADARSMNGPALKPRRRIGDLGGHTLVNNRRR